MHPYNCICFYSLKFVHLYKSLFALIFHAWDNLLFGSHVRAQTFGDLHLTLALETALGQTLCV